MLGNVTLIDDNDIDLFITEKVLLNHNCAHSIRKFSSPINALNYFEQQKKTEAFDQQTIIVDLHMPEMNGFEFLSAFSRLPDQLNSFKIFMLSTTENESELNQANSNKLLTRLLKKPLDIRELLK
ncbi:MAG TPA: response regulator [Bacteroidia bacterium]|nr:response regulator [Bacteroidia bacterium]